MLIIQRLVLSKRENEASECDSVVEISKSVLIWEVPKTEMFDVYGTKDK